MKMLIRFSIIFYLEMCCKIKFEINIHASIGKDPIYTFGVSIK